MIRPLLLVVALALPLAPASALERPLLRAEVTTADAVVTIGDFFRNPGPYADRPLFRAPDLGLTGTVPAEDVMRRAQAAGLANADAAGLRDVVVHRASLEIAPAAFEAAIRDALAERLGVADPQSLELRFATALPRLQADPTAAEPLSLHRLDYSSRSGRFDAHLTLRLDSRDMTVSIAGSARETVEVITLARRLARGETVTARDLTRLRVPRARLNDGTVTAAADIVGLATRRPQAPGRPLLSRDFEPPLLVHRRDKVIISYRTAGLALTVQGEALADAADGEVIDVLNIQSRRIVQATVTGPGRVAVTPRLSRLAGLKEASR